MATEVRTGYRKVGNGKSSRGLSRVRYVGTLAIYEDGQHLYSYTGNVHRLTPEDARQDARTEAESLIRQNPEVAIKLHSGAYQVSAIIRGHLVTRTYYGYTKREAARRFRQDVKGG